MIQNDEAFLEGTGELWSSYIMDPKGDYATFVINSDGSYLTSDNLSNWKNKIITVNRVDKDVMDEICSYIETYNKDGKKYYGYINLYKDEGKDDENSKTPEEVKELFDKYEISYIKRAVSAEVEKTKNFNGWSAYVYNKESKDDLVELDVGEFSPNKIKVVQENYNKAVHPDEDGENVFRYKLDAERVVSQKQDAQRGMTNIKIKYLFKNKKYYKYDGTQPTAYSIARDWDDILDIFAENKLVKEQNKKKKLTEDLKFLGRIALRNVLFGIYPIENNYDECEFTETLLDGYIDNIYYQNLSQLDKIDFKFARDFNNDEIADIASTNFKIGDTYNDLTIDETTKLTYDPRNPDLIGKVDINADALSAFSILENTHTASADYAYRDFKELIVELDYFDKEDLTMPATDILEWILPETDSAGWPLKTYDKYNDYGTMIHSKEMYENFDMLFSPYQEQYTDTGFIGFEKGQAIVSPATAKIIEMGTTTINNENADQLFDAIYVVRDDYDDADANSSGYVNKNSQSSNDDESAQKAFITEEQKKAIEQNGKALEENQNNSFGKSYTTGYIKLEVIGKESVDKILSVINDSNTKEGIKAFYEEYYNGKYDNSDKKTSVNQICDSYTIYIEGIDFRLDQSEGATWEFDNTILKEIMKKQENTSTNTTNKKESPELSWTPSSEIGGVTKTIDNYTKKEIPKYYPEARREIMKKNEEKKERMPFIFEFTSENSEGTQERQLYIKAGTLLGLCGDANIKIIMKDKNYSIVENCEEYFEIDDQIGSKRVIGGEISASENGYRTEDDIIYAIEHAGGWTEEMKNNVKSMMDSLLKMQNDFDIDPLVALAIFQGESSVGTAYDNEYRLDNHEHWEGCQCSHHQYQGFACYESYSDNAYDFGNYVRNRFDDGGDNIKTWNDLANFRGMIIYENCDIDDGHHAVSHYKKLVEALKSK